MGSYTAISDVSKTIISMLRTTCVPPVEKPELIGLCSPDDGGAFSVGVCLYDMDENLETRTGREIALDETHVAAPPFSLNLYYMIYAVLKSDVSMRAADEHRILGRVYQQLGDSRVIGGEYLQGTLLENSETVNIVYENKTLDEKLKIWSAYNSPPRPALFYKVNSILISSTRIREIKRVNTADISLKQKGGRLR